MSGAYKIVRHYRDSYSKRTIKTGLTLKEAQAHCSLESTHGDGWFDGYAEMQRPKRTGRETGIFSALREVYPERNK